MKITFKMKKIDILHNLAIIYKLRKFQNILKKTQVPSLVFLFYPEELN